MNGFELFALSVGSLPDSHVVEEVKAKLKERSAIMERIAQLQNEDSSLRDTYPVGEVPLAMIMDCRRKKGKQTMNPLDKLKGKADDNAGQTPRVP